MKVKRAKDQSCSIQHKVLNHLILKPCLIRNAQSFDTILAPAKCHETLAFLATQLIRFFILDEEASEKHTRSILTTFRETLRKVRMRTLGPSSLVLVGDYDHVF